MRLAKKIIHFFNSDDLHHGTLPDIYVENLTTEQVKNIYTWLINKVPSLRKMTVWSKTKKCDIEVAAKEIVEMYINGEIEFRRHSISGLCIEGTLIPELTIDIETKLTLDNKEDKKISFDYRIGKEWQEKEIIGMLKLLSHIKDMAPSANIYQAYEGCHDEPNIEFTRAFEAYYKSNGSV